MKRLALLSLLSFCFIAVFSFPVDTAKVNRTFALMVKSGYTAETQREFFDAFPVTWHELWLTYGNIPSFDNLKSSFRKHMYEGLYKLDKIPDSLFYDRLITLCIGGSEVVDDIGGNLHHLIKKKLEENPELMMERLSKKYYTAYFPFWYSLFNSLLCTDENVEIYRKLENYELMFKEKYPVIMNYMEQAFILSNGKAIFEDNRFPLYYKSHKPEEVKMQIQREDGVYFMAEQFPEYPGGVNGMLEFIKKNFKLPESYSGKNVYITVKVVIDTDGNIKSSTIDKSYDETADKEALRVVSLMPRWKAAIDKGKNVPCLFTIPFRYK